MKLISVIVTTYNWPEALRACLESLFAQDDRHFEIIIADDGSSKNTHNLVQTLKFQSPVSIKHAYQADKGFRAGTIRNKAVALSAGDYLVFLDGDCIVFPDFIQRHRGLAETGFFVPGNRILLSQGFTQTVLQQHISLHRQTSLFFIKCWLTGKINRLLPLLKLPFDFFRYWHSKRWQKAMTCNLALFRQDFMAVNGFDEAFEGWGYEDSDLVIRLIHNGIKRKEGRFAVPVLHLWHSHNSRDKQSENYARLMKRLADKNLIQASQGMSQYVDAQKTQESL